MSSKTSHFPHRRSWATALLGLLPLWLWSVAVTVEGFPRPPVSREVAIASAVISVAVSITILFARLVTIEVVAYSLFPISLLWAFDEISTTYKTPFIFLCAVILTVGLVGYSSTRLPRLQSALILLAIAGMAYLIAIHASSNFWEMADNLGYARCFPDAHGCAPLTGEEPPWWALAMGP